MIVTRSAPAWGQRWRSSPVFIVAAMGMALFTGKRSIPLHCQGEMLMNHADTFLYTFVVPILPYIIESRLSLDSSYTQRMSFALLSQSALVSVILSPLIGHVADKHSTKRIWLLSALVVALVGTGMIAVAMSPAVLFTGRFVQALASTVMWVVGFATIADNVKQEHLGKTYGVISTVVAIGTSAGPMLSGILFDLGGYWLAWSSTFVVLVLDIVLRLLMLERSKESKGKDPSSTANRQVDSETAPLLQNQSATGTKEQTGLRFYSTLFHHRRFICGVYTYLVFAVLISSFDTTLPLHVRDVFSWGSMQSGLLFVALQSPGIPLSVLVGWIKDRWGTRLPTSIGLLLLTPLIWFLGVPGDDRFPFANEGDRGRIIYSVTMALIGMTICLLNGAGTIEATGNSFHFFVYTVNRITIVLTSSYSRRR